MMRSLFSSVAGLRNHQIWMDVIGNNIANVNTIGYKYARYTFKDLMSQTLSGAMMGSALQGGINPVQVGLGSGTSSIDTMFTQGNLQSTGNVTDLAIQGEGFFILRKGSDRYYSRAGNFRFDSQGYLVDPNGCIVQGIMADENGNIASGSAIEDIQLPFDMYIPARATTRVGLSGNLNADSDPLGTILDSNPILADAAATEDVNGLYNGAGNLIELESGVDTVTFDPTGSDPITLTYGVDFTTLQELADALEAHVQTIAGHNTDTIDVTTNADGETVIVWNNVTSEPSSVFLSSNGALRSIFASFNGAVAGSVESDNFLHTATGSDNLTDIYSSGGTWAELQNGDVITINATVGESPVAPVNLTVGTDVTTLEDLRLAIQSALSLPAGSVTIDSDGSIRVEGEEGLDYEISNLSVQATRGDLSLSPFNSIMDFNQIQAARDAGIHSVSIDVYDSLGFVHALTITFEKVPDSNTWTWTVSVEEPATVISGGSGTVTFNPDGTLASFSYDDGATRLEIEPGTGATTPISIEFDPGDFGTITGLSQFASPFSAVADEQDGYAMGDLIDISISPDGTITGVFSNGLTRTMAQIALAEFTNPGGLMKEGDNLYKVSASSGEPAIGQPGGTISSIIVPGSLEMSNVDLALEFTNMIIAQRAYQANARTISTSDAMLGELVSLKR